MKYSDLLLDKRRDKHDKSPALQIRICQMSGMKPVAEAPATINSTFIDDESMETITVV